MNSQRINFSSRILVLGLVAIILLLGIGLSSLAFAAGSDPIEVNSPGDEKKSNDGFCTLREAIIAANSNKKSGGIDGECEAGSGTGTDVILLPAGVYMLERTDNGGENSSQTGDLDIQEDVIIQRSGPGLAVISGGSITDRVFHIQPGQALALDGVTIRDGDAIDFGGGIFNDGGTLYLTNSTLTGNFAATSGGALYNQNNGSDVANSYLTNVTITENDAGAAGGLGNSSGTLEVKNTIISGDSCSTAVTFLDENLAYNAPGCPPASLAEDPLLDPVKAPTDYLPIPDRDLLPPGTYVLFELQPDSPAINQIETADCPTPPFDQLSLERPQGPGNLCDIGAVELEFTYLVVSNTSDDIAVEGSLPWAIDQANTTPGIDTIVFAIGGVCAEASIYLNSPLPDITEAVVIDGTLNEDDARCDDVHITIDGNGNDFSGITILYSAEGTTIRDLNIRNFGLNGIVILGDANEPTDNEIKNTIQGNVIQDNGGSGIVIGEFDAPSHGNLITGNTISGNGFLSDIFNDGVTIPAGVNNELSVNDFFGNADLAVDLGADGMTENDPGDFDDLGANQFQNYPVLYWASTQGYAGGFLDTQPGSYSLQFFSSLNCLDDQPLSLIHEATVEVTLDGNGVPIPAEIAEPVAPSLAQGTGIRVTATDAAGNTSELSECVAAEENNVVWNLSKEISYGPENAVNQYLSTDGESRWYYFLVQPGMEVTIDLFDLPANYDLTVYKDIEKTYEDLQSGNGDGYDLDRASAETPAEMISSTAYSPYAFTPYAFTPYAFTPYAFTPYAFTPYAFTPYAFTPYAFTQDVIAPSSILPYAFTPYAFTPYAFTPYAFTPNDFLSDVDPALYASAQVSSLIAVSAFDNTASESVKINTFTNSGKYFIRVRGRNGAAVSGVPYSLQITKSTTACDVGDPTKVTGDGPIAYGNTIDPQTIIVADWTRLNALYGDGGVPDQNTPGTELYELNQKLEILADAYNGVIVEIGQENSLIHKRNAIADTYYACPYAKNLVAEEIKKVIDDYRFDPTNLPNDNLEYVVILGSDEVVPFFRVPDEALLGPESWFHPPVLINKSSEASLRANFVLTDDFYGSKVGISYKNSAIPGVDLAVGRMVENPLQMLNQIDAFLSLTYVNGDLHGVVNRDQNGNPTDINSFVTGYDFLVDAVKEITEELSQGTGITPDTLVTPHDVAPLENPEPFVESGIVDSGGPWTADNLLERLANNDKDLIFFAGHFSASSALSADFETGISTVELLDLADQGGDWTNVIVYSAGCHSGYNIVNEHSTLFTLNPDWASAIADLGGILIGGTGYQYGDTQFLEYSERLYLYFTEELRTGHADSISVGQAMVAAKQRYLAETPSMRGIHQKALIEATVFGLPMLAVDMPNRITPTPSETVITTLTAETENPGAALGLQSAPVEFDFTANWHPDAQSLHVVDLNNAAGGDAITASWYSGDRGVLANLGEPTVPLFAKNIASPLSGYTLRGVGFRGGTYEDITELVPNPDEPTVTIPVFPLIDAATTEVRATNLSFIGSFWFPIRTWSLNLYDSLLNDGGASLFVTPVQYMTDQVVLASGAVPPPAVMRRFNEMEFVALYSNYTADAGVNQPAQAAPPDIARVTSAPNEDETAVDVEVLVVGNPGAGVHNVWITYTGQPGSDFYGVWQSLDLDQNLDENGLGDSRIWRGSFDVPDNQIENVRFFVQSCNGMGRCSQVDNLGDYFTPGVETEAVLTTLSQPQSDIPDNMQKVGDEVTFTATLTPDETVPDMSGNTLFFGLGTESRVGITDEFGNASATFLVVGAPGPYEVTAWFPGNSNYAASTSQALPFAILQQKTTLTLGGPALPVPTDGPLPVTALLEDQSANELPLAEQAVLFAVFEDGVLDENACPENDQDAQVAAGSAYKTVYTGLTGEAPLGEVDLGSGDYVVCAYFRANPSYGGSRAQLEMALNTPPAATADVYSINLGDELALAAPGVLGNDTDPDGDTLTAELISPPTSPAFITALAADGSFTYQLQGPVPLTFQTSFTYRACDPHGACSAATTVTIEFNQPPVCEAVMVETEDGDSSLWPVNKDKTGLVLEGASDPDGPPPREVLFGRIWMDEVAADKQPVANINPSCEGAWVLSDRDPQLDGRVYRIDFFLRDIDGAYCWGSRDIATLPHDQSGDAEAIIGPDPFVEVASCSIQLPPPQPGP